MNDPEKKLSEIAEREVETLMFWREKGIFEKSLEQTRDGEAFSFYDGPPFATGLPHYGHILASTIKDAIPRYQTMRGRYVRRVWGWDCHGLPVENLIEEELGLGHKKDIEAYGIEKFNQAAYDSVLRYDAEWKKIIPRIGRWVDMEHEYKTMDASYTESVWWAFKTLHEKGLVYQGFKAMQICPRCETTLSNNEVADEYKDITDISVTVKFELAHKAGVYILAWTTTPWTLPGNVALAVNPDEEYVKVAANDEEYILAALRVEQVFKDKEHTVLERFKGEDLAGTAYKPVFDYYIEQGTLVNRENGWKVYAAPFVTMESGTGVVHIAPAFGEDDYALGKKENLPFVQHVAMDGTMKKEVRDFVGLEVKPKSKEKDGHQATDIAIIKHLAGAGALFSKEKIVHAYPHCWRCKTPLLNYAAESWFVKVPEIRDKMVALNRDTKWVPETMRDGRFGKWLEGAREWAISRARYWGAPLPVWACAGCEDRWVAGSRAELVAKTKRSGNRYLVMRHGIAESNARGVVNSKAETSGGFGLTPEGREAVLETGKKLLNEDIDMIVTSPFVRTKQTAEIVAGAIGFDTRKIIVDDRLKEIDTGMFDGHPVGEYRGYFASQEEKFTKRPDGGENLLDVKRRVMNALEELETKYADKTILVVTHEYPIWMLATGVEGANIARGVELKDGKEDFVLPGQVTEMNFVPFPHNADFEYDTHRPHIDTIPVACACGGTMTRVPYVFDCWFESGSMPYAQFHYPFENKELFEKNFPADFIAEGVDQTRGWFYSLMVLATGLFDKAPFRQVIVNGMVLAEDGQKMSKSLKNYPDPWYLLDRYGADAVRYYFLSSPVVHGEEFAFSERGVDEAVKKVIVRMVNTLSFYELYQKEDAPRGTKSTNPLDQWVLARLAELGREMTLSFDRYELDRAVKPIGLFVDDLSTWYIRRSRDRFKSDNATERAEALATTRTVLVEFAKLLAPVMPFLAEHIYQKAGGEKESVHLESWPSFEEPDREILLRMGEVRRAVSLALEARAKAGVKVRQPLAKLLVSSTTLVGKEELIAIIRDEVNVEKVEAKEGELAVELDTNITPELKRKGQYRELLRSVQELRKTNALTPADVVTLVINTDDSGRALVEEFTSELKKTALLNSVAFKDLEGEAMDIDGISFKLAIEK